MTAAVVTDEGLKNSLDARLAARLFLRLFRNDVSPVFGSVLGDFTPAAFPSYADFELTGSWPAAAIDGAGRAFSTQVVNWTRGAGGVPETDYGWVMYQNPDPDSQMVAGKRLTFPAVTNAEFQVVTVRVTVYLLRG